MTAVERTHRYLISGYDSGYEVKREGRVWVIRLRGQYLNERRTWREADQFVAEDIAMLTQDWDCWYHVVYPSASTAHSACTCKEITA